MPETDATLRRVAEQLLMLWGDECTKSVLRPVDFRHFLGHPAWRELEALLDEQAVRDAEAVLDKEDH